MSTKLTLTEINKQLDKKELSDKLKADLKAKAKAIANNKEILK
jgi:hypothetical protein